MGQVLWLVTSGGPCSQVAVSVGGLWGGCVEAAVVAEPPAVPSLVESVGLLWLVLVLRGPRPPLCTGSHTRAQVC